MNSSQIKRKIDKASIVSFDIFDTLLLRPYMKPTDLFRHLEELTGKRGFYHARIHAERHFYATNGNVKEADIHDIYNFLPEYAELKDEELALEYRGLKINYEVKEWYDYAIEKKKTVIIASDMYLPLSFINDVLNKNGISGYHRLYLSHELNRRKDRGDMYDYIINDLGANPHSILHIGDNVHSDYRQARRHGCRAILYPQLTLRFLKRHRPFTLFYPSDGSLGSSIMTALAAQKPVTGDYWHRFGYYYAGPFAYSYVRWVYEKCIEENIDKVLFVARDGYLANEIFKLLNRAEIKSHYVYAPRILNYTTHLDYHNSVQKQAAIICTYFGKNPPSGDCHTYIQENKEEFLRLAEQEKEKTGYKDYIRNIIGEARKVGVVDTISGQFSAQKLIEREGNTKTCGFYVLTYSWMKDKSVSEMQHYDFVTQEHQKSFMEGNLPNITELIFSSKENPIITMTGGTPVHQRTISDGERRRQEIYQRIESGVLDFIHDVLQRFGNHCPCIGSASPSALLRAYVANPSNEDIKAMFSVTWSPYADNSVYLPLFSAPTPFWKVWQLNGLTWLTRPQRMAYNFTRPLRIVVRFLRRHGILKRQ